jgi:hypothetical protein
VLPREAVEGHASAAALVLVPLVEPWAERRFVVVSRGDGSLAAPARDLVQHLRSRAEQAADGAAPDSIMRRRSPEEPAR